MKPLIPIAAILALLSVCLPSCDNDSCIEGTGPIITRQLDVPDFSAIVSSSSFDVNIMPGAELKVEATGNGNIIDRLDTMVTDGLWEIELRSGCYRNFNLEIFITLPELDRVTNSGSGDVFLNGFFLNETFEVISTGSGNTIHNGTFEVTQNTQVSNTGSGDIKLNVESPDILASVSGSGSITMSGAANTLNLRNSGSGNFEGFALVADTVFANSSGSGNCNIAVNTLLDVIITGSGNITYRGMPATLKSTITGSGRLIDGN